MIVFKVFLSTRFFVAISIQFLLLGPASLAAAELRLVRPASSVVRERQRKATFEQYQKLVKQKVSQMPELSWLWKQRRSLINGTNNMEHRRLWSQVYFAGGGLRSLLHWIDQQLATRTYEEVWKLSPPRLSKLVLPDADKDILTNLDAEDFKNGYGDAEGWDVLKRDFWRASLEVGGSSIEKVGVNPDEIRDKFGAIRAYYDGRLTFVSVPESDFARYRKTGSKLNQNSRIALVVRHLRFLVLYSDGAVTEQDVEDLRAIVREEVPFIKQHNYWIAKSLRKIDQEIRRAGGGQEDILNILRQTDLFVPLAKNGFLLNDKTPLAMLARSDEGVDFGEAVNIGKREKNKIDHAVGVMQKSIALARTPEAYLSILSVEVRNPSKEYRSQIDDLWQQHAKSFCALNPTIEQIHRARRLAGFINGSMAILRACLHVPRTPADFIEFTQFGVPSPSDAFREATRLFWLNNLKAFLKLDPNLADIQLAKKSTGRIDTILEMLAWALPKVTSARDAFLLVHPGIDHANETYTNALNAFWVQIVDHAPLEMSPSEYTSFVAKIPNETARKKLLARLDKDHNGFIRDRLAKATTPQEILDAFSMPRDLNFERRSKRDELLRGQIEKFCALKPSLDEIGAAKSLIDDLETQFALRRTCLPTARSASEFISIMSRGTTHLPESFADAIAADWEQRVDAFVAFGPSVDEAKAAIAAASPEGQLKLIEAMIPSVKTLDEALVLTTPRIANPSVSHLRRIGLLWIALASRVPTLGYRKEAVEKFMNVVQDKDAKVAVLGKLMSGRRAKGLLKIMAVLEPVADKDRFVVERAVDDWARAYGENHDGILAAGELSRALGSFGWPVARHCLPSAGSISDVAQLFGFLRASRDEANLARAREIFEAHADLLVRLMLDASDLVILEGLVDPLPARLRYAGIERFHERLSVRDLNTEISKLARVTDDEDERRKRELLHAFEVYVAREGDPRARVLLADQFPLATREIAYETLLKRTESLADGLALIPTLYGDGRVTPERIHVLARVLAQVTEERDFVTLVQSIKYWSSEDRTALFTAVERERSVPLLEATQLAALRPKIAEDVFFDYLLVYFSKIDVTRVAEVVRAIDFGSLSYRVRLAGFLKTAVKLTSSSAPYDPAPEAVARPRGSSWWLRTLSVLNRNDLRQRSDRANCERLLRDHGREKSESASRDRGRRFSLA